MVLEGLLETRPAGGAALGARGSVRARTGYPYDPGDGPARPEDAEIRAYLAESYAVSDSELDRMSQANAAARQRGRCFESATA